ncbi:hypothetical protein BDV09DRAFT_203813 [Aspergillus tetrazonus]
MHQNQTFLGFYHNVRRYRRREYLDSPAADYKQGAGNKKKKTDDVEDDDIVFQFANGDMGSLNRYLHGGRVLPLTSDAYFQRVGILDQDKLTAKIKAQSTLQWRLSRRCIHKDCNGFLGDVENSSRHTLWTKGMSEDDFDKLSTSEKMDVLSGQIYSYSEDAGGDTEVSYYTVMLQYCKKFNEATDSDAKEEARTAVVEITESLLGDIAPIQTHIEKIKSELNEFDKTCETNASDLSSLETNMTALLNDELGQIDELEKQISEQLDDIKADQRIIDDDRYQQQLTAAYVWIPVIGTVAAAVVFAEKQEEIEKYEKKIRNLKNLIESEQESILLHKTLQGNLTSMAKQTKELKDQISPAKTTVEELAGGWEFMRVQIQDIYDKAAKFEDKIPTMVLTQLQLEKIVKAWNDLNKYVSSYIQVANVVPPITTLPIGDYLDQLDEVQKSKRTT